MRRRVGVLVLVAACDVAPVEVDARDNVSCESAIELAADTRYAIKGELTGHGDIHDPQCGDPGPERVRDAVFGFAIDEPRLLLVDAHHTTTYLALESGTCGAGAEVACSWYQSGGFFSDGTFAGFRRRLAPADYTLFVEGTETAEDYRLDFELRAPRDAPDGAELALPIDYVAGEGARTYHVDVPPYHLLKLYGGGEGTYELRGDGGVVSRGDLAPGSYDLTLEAGRYELVVEAPGAFDLAIIDYSAD
jgi:hypothetical protein